MTYSYSARLTALDATFLAIEDRNAHMHVGAVSLFDAAPLRDSSGCVDMDRVRRVIDVGLHRAPRYRQRLAYVPLFGYPVWVDDDRFNLNYHVHHLSLPKPGDTRLLKRLAGRIMSQQLDRGKPLWECWVVEGVEGDRLALITKAHHCMIDGVGSVELTKSLMQATPEIERRLDDPPRWLPRPAPSPAELLLSELARRAAEPLQALGAVRRSLADPRHALQTAENALVGIGEAIGAGLRPASPTPLNIDIGPHRRFDWLDMELGVLKEIKSRLGGTLNDVVLTIVSGALGRFLHVRGLRVDDLDFRAMIPVNFRNEKERDSMGNRVTMMVAQLPIEERDPRRRLQRVCDTTRALKRSRQALGVKTLQQVSDWTVMAPFTAFARMSALTRPYNVVITNIPGPQFTTYFLGAPMTAVYPLVPLFSNQALGVAIFSYDGKLFWGFNSDWDAVPDLHELVNAVSTEFDLLRNAAAMAPAPAVAATGSKRPRPTRARYRQASRRRQRHTAKRAS